MKNLKLLLSTLVITLIATSGVLAQDNIVDASAEVLANISFDAEQAVNFGNVQPDLAPTPDLDPANNTSSGVQGGSVQFGYLLFSGAPNQDVVIGISGGTSGTPDQETLTSGGNQITYDIEVAEVAGDQTGSNPSGTIITDGAQVSLTDTNGDHTLWIGGQLSGSTPSPAPAGTYSGTVVFDIDYTF